MCSNLFFLNVYKNTSITKYARFHKSILTTLSYMSNISLWHKNPYKYILRRILSNFLKPAKHIKPLPENQIDDTYKRLRLQVFLGIFIGYAGYYLLRKNFSLAMPALQEQGFTKAELGFALSAVSIAYGFSKFFMGTVSDRSNARIF